MPSGAFFVVGAVLTALLSVGAVVVVTVYFELWLRAYVTRTKIGLTAMVLMSLRKVNPKTIVEAQIMAVQAELAQIATNDLEAHYLAGGDVRRVVQALITAHRAQIELDWNTAAVIDLAGRNVLKAVQMSVNPIVIDCPDPRQTGNTMLTAVAKDGIQLKVQVRVTVRANLSQLVGGATEETIVARVRRGGRLIYRVLRQLQDSVIESHADREKSDREGTRLADGFRNRLDRHRRYQRGREHRSPSANRSG